MNKKLLLIIIFGLALFLRIGLLFTAYHGDLNNNISWGNLVVERGFNSFYEGKEWPYSNPNQPPLTILTFAGTSFLWKTIENVAWYLNDKFTIFPSSFIWFWEEKGMTLLVKLPSILSDLIIGYLIYRYISKKEKKRGLLIASLWLFNPVVWYNSAVWGQTDAVVNLFGFLGILFLLNKKIIPSIVFWTLSILFKGSLVVFLPVIFLFGIFQKIKLSDWVKGIIAGLLVVVAISFCFHPQPDFPVWLFNLYSQRIFPGEIGDLTANAFNFWWLVDPGKVLDSTIYFGLPARIWGIIILALGIFTGLFWLKKKPSEKRLFYVLAFVSLLSFLFMTRIHERYLYPFLIPATVLVGFMPTTLPVYLVLSLTSLLNLYHLFYAPGIPLLEKLYEVPSFMNFLAVINILVFLVILSQPFLKVFRQKDL